METATSDNYISLDQRRLEKFDKKVTWSETLMEIKMITPQPSVFENLTEIVFSEEEEDIFIEDKEQVKLLDSNFCDKPIRVLVDSLSTPVENIQNKNYEEYFNSFHKNPKYSENCTKSSECTEHSQNMEIITQRTFEEERKNLDKSLQQIFGSKVSHMNEKK